MDFEKVRLYVEEFLQRNLPEHLFYHNARHTVDVLEASVQIAERENIHDPEDLLILKTAALFHDTGMVKAYSGHEAVSCHFADTILPDFGFTKEQILRINQLIMKTKMPQSPDGILEKILCDADLDYLGRADYEEISQDLYREWKEIGRIYSTEQWRELQVDFLTQHHYWTNSSRSIRQPVKEAHLKRMLQK